MDIKIKTLTPIHVGNGTELQGNFEYLYFQEEGQIAILDAEKVLTILGEENISQWVSCIDKDQDLLPVIQKRKAILKAIDVAERTIPLSNKTTKPIRINIRGGNNTALIPGSSVKGSLRTAIWAQNILDSPKLVQDERNLKNFRGAWSDEFVSKNIFGGDPNHDIFRLLQVGDAAFSETEVYETRVINMYGNDWRLKKPLDQFVEAIPAGVTTTMRLNYNDILRKHARGDYFNSNAAKLELSELFSIVNQHTGRIIEDEYIFWKDKIIDDDSMGDYVEQMQRILNISKNCDRNECVLRVGWGSGYRSMTGDWQGCMNDEDYYRLVRKLRPDLKYPDGLLFPKTTRFVNGGMPLGFVKLTL